MKSTTDNLNQKNITPENSIAWANNYFRVWNEALYDEIENYYTNDVVYRDLNLGTSSTGLSELKQFMQDNINAYEGLRFEAKDVVLQNENKIAVVWIMTGAYEGEPFTIEGMSIMELREGKVFKNSDYYK